MIRWLRPRPWPPALERDETVLLEGAGSIRRFWVSLAVGVLLAAAFGAVLDAALDWALGRPPRLDLPPPPSTFTIGLWSVSCFLIFLWNRRWMLTSRRLVTQGGRAIPRDEIGRIELASLGGVIVHRAGPDQLLRGPQLSLWLLDDPRGVRDALERLR